ncbi:hypothetical protein [Pseudomonas sp. A014]|uniref:hypothetical protein n=1 Tax=Pseudomonas sp. A014 TaxID=3458058 RepID=UPI00403737FC
MPTENRSTMVSVPRELTREMLNGVCMHPDLARSIWSALLKSAPQPAQHQGEPFAWFDPKTSHFLTADGRATTLSMGHGDRLERYSVPLYIHPVPAEPVAEVRYMGYEPSNHLNWLNGNDLQLLADGKKLYTHPAPADPNMRWKAVADEQVQVITGLKSEVERLRAEIERMRERVTPTHKSLIGKHAEIIKERDTLRAWLAERDALLRGLKNRPVHEWASGKIDDEIDAALSASAEPVDPNKPCNHDYRLGECTKCGCISATE